MNNRKVLYIFIKLFTALRDSLIFFELYINLKNIKMQVEFITS